MVNISYPSNKLYQYHIDKVLQSDNNSYEFELTLSQLGQYQFWKSFDIAISVKNSIGWSQFSNFMTIASVTNGKL